VIRAFTYFSHLANLAEDRHHIRRRAVHERAGDTQEGSIEVALARLRWAGISTRTISTRWRTALSRRCSRRTPPKCSARASWTPNATSPSC
jgi:phosphoenolpyruvate carboxylase